MQNQNIYLLIVSTCNNISQFIKSTSEKILYNPEKSLFQKNEIGWGGKSQKKLNENSQSHAKDWSNNEQ